MVLPVKVNVDQATLLAHTVDITGNGARLGGLRTQLQVGGSIELVRGSRRAKFHIKWIKQLGETEVQIGIECPEPQDKFWGVDLTDRDREGKKDMDALMTLLRPSSKQA